MYAQRSSIASSAALTCCSRSRISAPRAAFAIDEHRERGRDLLLDETAHREHWRRTSSISLLNWREMCWEVQQVHGG